jgi:hypothetical protein
MDRGEHRLALAIFEQEDGGAFKCRMQNAKCKMEVIREVYTGLDGGGPTFGKACTFAGASTLARRATEDRTAGRHPVFVPPPFDSWCFADDHAHYAMVTFP